MSGNQMEEYEEQVERITLVKQHAYQPTPKPAFLMQKGMTISFYGYTYKVIAVRPNGKVTLKLKGRVEG